MCGICDALAPKCAFHVFHDYEDRCAYPTRSRIRRIGKPFHIAECNGLLGDLCQDGRSRLSVVAGTSGDARSIATDPTHQV